MPKHNSNNPANEPRKGWNAPDYDGKINPVCDLCGSDTERQDLGTFGAHRPTFVCTSRKCGYIMPINDDF